MADDIKGLQIRLAEGKLFVRDSKSGKVLFKTVPYNNESPKEFQKNLYSDTLELAKQLRPTS